jgi:long-chain acyl-CoA synthetase
MHGASLALIVDLGPEQAETLQALVSRLAAYGDAPAVIEVGPSKLATVSFAQLVASANDRARELRANGVEPGEPVGIVAPNSAAWIGTCLGILAAGASVMPLDVKQGEPERNALIAANGCRIVFVADGVSNGKLTLALRRFARNASIPVGRDVALLLHTSGTTGTPKAVPLSHTNVLANLRALVAERLVDRDVRALLPLPLHHVYPLVVGLLLPLSVGGTVVLPGGISGPELARALKAAGVNTLVGVPRLYDALRATIASSVKTRGPLVAWIFDRTLAHSIADVHRGRYGFGRRVFGGVRRTVAPALYRLACGGAALDEATEEALLGLGYAVIVGYGLTETAPLVTFNRPGRGRLGSAGQPLPGVELRIVRAEADGVGEIEVRGPNVFAGYRDDEAATARALGPDGWFRTGDRGRVDVDGYLYLHGRAGETLVLPGGEKLDPETLEASYATSPVVGEIAVMIEGGKLVALVVPAARAPRAGALDDERAIRSALRERGNELPRYMQLAGVAIIDEPLPRTLIGKLQRHRLQSLYRAARGRAEARSAPPRELSPADRALLADPGAGRIWAWLETRFPQTHLSLEMSPQLDLGVDSLGWIELTVDLERALGIRLDEAALEHIVTLRDLIVAAQAAAPARADNVAATWLEHPSWWEHAVWSAGQVLNRLLVRLISRVRTEGTELLPQRGPYVLCPNHSSYLDAPALAATLPWTILDQVVWAGSVDVMFSNPVSRLFSRLARVLPIDPVRGARTGLALSAQTLGSGRILVWFPEGWRTTDGLLRPFLPGIGALMLRAPVPIIPVRIEGTFAAWPAQRRFPRPHPIVVRFGPPIAPERWEALSECEDAAVRIAAAVKAEVAALGGATR